MAVKYVEYRTHTHPAGGGWVACRQAGGQTGPVAAGRQQAGLAAGGSGAARREKARREKGSAVGAPNIAYERRPDDFAIV